MPGIVHAALELCPVFRGAIDRFDAAAVRARKGVIAIVPINSGLVPAGQFDRIAVVADSWWTAKLVDRQSGATAACAQMRHSTEGYGKAAAALLAGATQWEGRAKAGGGAGQGAGL